MPEESFFPLSIGVNHAFHSHNKIKPGNIMEIWPKHADYLIYSLKPLPTDLHYFHTESFSLSGNKVFYPHSVSDFEDIFWMLERKKKNQIAEVRGQGEWKPDYIGSICILVLTPCADLSMVQLSRRCILPALLPVNNT